MSPAVIYVDVSEKALQKYRESFDLSTMPKGFGATYEAMTEFERSRWFLERFKCLKSPLYLAGSVAE
jgi:hypothetical protein